MNPKPTTLTRTSLCENHNHRQTPEFRRTCWGPYSHVAGRARGPATINTAGAAPKFTAGTCPGARDSRSIRGSHRSEMPLLIHQKCHKQRLTRALLCANSSELVTYHHEIQPRFPDPIETSLGQIPVIKFRLPDVAGRRSRAREPVNTVGSHKLQIA